MTTNTDNCKRWVDAVASFCGLDNRNLKKFSQNVPHVMDTCCPHAVQIIMGALQIRNNSFEGRESSLAEYRACEEWELLISEALLGSCVNIGWGGRNRRSPDWSKLDTGLCSGSTMVACTRSV